MKAVLGKLFGRRKYPGADEVPTRPISLDPSDFSLKTPQAPLVPPQLVVGCGHSVGHQRDHNEDALFTLTTALTSDHSNIPFGLYILADGMGGHQHGEVASGIAVRSMANYVIRKLYVPMYSVKPTSPQESFQEIMQAAVQDAHNTILKQAPGSGTTLTAVLVLGEQLTIAHVGDSRAYLVHPDGKMDTLTRDHSLVNRLVELGQLTTEEAAIHPQRNVLYRALGQGEPFEADVATIPLPHGSHLMLCSDGLWGVVPDERMSSLIRESSSPAAACQSLVDAANSAGGPDNITAVLVRLPE